MNKIKSVLLLLVLCNLGFAQAGILDFCKNHKKSVSLFSGFMINYLFLTKEIFYKSIVSKAISEHERKKGITLDNFSSTDYSEVQKEIKRRWAWGHLLGSAVCGLPFAAAIYTGLTYLDVKSKI